jgi:hypothetical protein
MDLSKYLIGVDVNPCINPWIDKFHQLDLSKPSSYLEKIHLFNNKVIINFASLSHVDNSFDHPIEVIKNNIGIAHCLKLIQPLFGIHISTDEVEYCSNPYSMSKYGQELILAKTNWNFVRLNNLYGSFNIHCYPTQPTIWNNLNKCSSSNPLRLVRSYKSISRNFLPVQIACKYLYEYLQENKSSAIDQTLDLIDKSCKLFTVKPNTRLLYYGYKCSLEKFISEYEKKYAMEVKKVITKDRPQTDWKYSSTLPISYEKFYLYL